MATSYVSSPRHDLTRSATPDSFISNITVDVGSSNAQSSSSSTPPTSDADSTSVSSELVKIGPKTNDETGEELGSASTSRPLGVPNDEAGENPGPSSSSRPSRVRTGPVRTYNVKVLSGTAVHAPKKFRKPYDGRDAELELSTRRRTISGDTLVESMGTSANASNETLSRQAAELVRDGIEVLDLPWSVEKLPKSRSQIELGQSESPTQSPRQSPRKTKAAPSKAEVNRRRSTRLSGEHVESFTRKLSVLGKRGRKAFEGLAKGKRELKRLADTNEFAKIDTAPVLTEVWANGKLLTEEPPQKKVKVKVESTGLVKSKEEEEPVTEQITSKGRREKIWLSRGLYAGQEVKPAAYLQGKGTKEPATDKDYKATTMLPLPMWAGARLLQVGRDFKLPFDVCSPLPPGQPKPDEWRKSSKNRFVGDAAAAWKKVTLFDDFSSRCVCTKQGGCGDSCQNRIMLYECDEGNCSVGPEHCTNRSFADLQERRSKGGKYRIGVEVIKTEDRGYGVRTNRCYDAHQIIVEYTGEIITEEECDRRMNEDYKHNECYYLMSFDQNMIIDATRGSIARFVNHSCEPNCRMVKWIVNGKPRMALFAGDKPVLTGEELTYDYNFDPFSAKNVQECRCGSENCRGVLGPRPRDQKSLKASAIVGNAVQRAVNAGKRKLKELLGGEADEAEKTGPKKRKLAIPKGKSASARALSVARSISKKFSKSVTVGSKRGSTVVVKRTSKTTKSYRLGGRKKQSFLSSRNSSLTLVGSEPKTLNENGKGKNKGEHDVKRRPVKKNLVNSIRARGLKKSKTKHTMSRNTIRVVSATRIRQDSGDL